MKNYTAPIAIMNEDLMEGIYAASGSKCYSVRANIHQSPEQGRGDYRIQVTAQHNADHTCDKQKLTLTFNQPVTPVSATNGIIKTHGTSAVLEIEYSYWNNPIDAIGLGDVIVTSEQGLIITGARLTD